MNNISIRIRDPVQNTPHTYLKPTGHSAENLPVSDELEEMTSRYSPFYFHKAYVNTLTASIRCRAFHAAARKFVYLNPHAFKMLYLGGNISFSPGRVRYSRQNVINLRPRTRV